VWQHKHDVIQGFTRKYNVKTLVYHEVHENAESALTREKKIKRWRRAWKLALIEDSNPEWRDLYEDILG
jgi:putative endonuclease